MKGVLCNNHHLKNYQRRAGFTTLHSLKHISTLVLQIYIAFAPRSKTRLYVLPRYRGLFLIDVAFITS